MIGCPAVRHKRAPELRGDGARLGMAVSKKVGPAVVRNRLRRLIREVFRAARSELPPVELVVIAKPPAAALAGEGLEALRGALLPQLRSAAGKAGRGPRRPRRAAPSDGRPKNKLGERACADRIMSRPARARR